MCTGWSGCRTSERITFTQYGVSGGADTPVGYASVAITAAITANPARTSAIANPRRGNRSLRGMGVGFATGMSPTRASFLPLLRRDYRLGSVVADSATAPVRHVDY